MEYYATLGMAISLLIVILYNTIKILKEYERGVIFLLGRFQKVKGPGLIILFPGIQKMTKVDLRVIVLDVPTHSFHRLPCDRYLASMNSTTCSPNVTN